MSLDLLVRILSFLIWPLSQTVNSILPIQSGPDLLICVHKALQLAIQVSILRLQHIAVIRQSIYFNHRLFIPHLQSLICKSQLIKFWLGAQ